MKYTRENFDGVCERVLGTDLFKDLSLYGPSKVLDIVIIRIWGDEIKLMDGEESIIRQAYLDLKSPGYFQFEE